MDSKSTAGDSVPVRVRPPAPYRVFITDLSYEHSISFYLYDEQASRACSFLCTLDNILDSHAFAGIGDVIRTTEEMNIMVIGVDMMPKLVSTSSTVYISY